MNHKEKEFAKSSHLRRKKKNKSKITEILKNIVWRKIVMIQGLP